MDNEPLASEGARRQALAAAHAAPRCGARSKRTGKPCQGPAMANRRCRMHGGKSTGPRTPEGLERSRKANWKHGGYSAAVKADRKASRSSVRLIRQIIAALG